MKLFNWDISMHHSTIILAFITNKVRNCINVANSYRYIVYKLTGIKIWLEELQGYSIELNTIEYMLIAPVNIQIYLSNISFNRFASFQMNKNLTNFVFVTYTWNKKNTRSLISPNKPFFQCTYSKNIKKMKI